MRKKTRTRIGSMLLVAVMLLSLLPVTAWAEENINQNVEPLNIVEDDTILTEGTSPAVDDTQSSVTTVQGLTDAINSASDGDTIVLGAEITSDTTLTIPEGKSLTLDLNSNKLSLTQIKVDGSLTICDGESGGRYASTLSQENKGAIEVGANGLLTLESGTIQSATKNYGVYVSDGGKAVVNGGTINSTYAALTGNNTTGDMNFEVHGGTLNTTSGPAIYMPGQVSLTITGGTLNGGISLRMGQVDISGGVINAITTGIDAPNIYYNFSGNAWLPDALYVFNGTYTSENATYGNSLNLNITGGTFNCTNDQGSAVAIYDLGRVEQTSKISISGTAKLSSRATGRTAYQVLSLEDINVTSPTEGYGVHTGDVESSITGGTFSTDVSEYVAPNYECIENQSGTYTVQKLEDKLVVEGSVGSDGNVTGSLEGSFNTGADIVDNTDGNVAGGTETSVSGSNVTVDLTTSGQSSATTTTLEVTQETAATLNNANTLTVKTDAADVSFDSAALDKISEAEDQVTITVKDTTSSTTAQNNVKASYEVSVEANGTNLLPNSANNGTVTITVPVPQGVDNPVAWYVQDGVFVTNLGGNKSTDGMSFTFSITHLSEIYIVDGEITSNVVASCVENDGETHYYNTLAEAVQNAASDTKVTLLNDTKLTTGVDVDKKLTLDLNGYTITDDTNSWTTDSTKDYLVAVKRGGDLTIQDSSAAKTGAITSKNSKISVAVKMTIKDEDANGNLATLTVDGGTLAGYYYGISGNGTRHNTKITINNGTITATNPGNSEDRVAIYQPQNGELIVNGGTITANTGIEVRSGSLTVNGGTISGGNGTPVADPNGNGTTTTNTGIAVAQHTTNNPITVNINGGTISGSAAVYESNPQNNGGGSAVTVNVQDATLNGDLMSSGFGTVAVENTNINGDVSKTGTGNMGLTEVTVTGNVTKDASNSGSLGLVNSTISGTAPANDGTNGVTYVNTTVQDTVTNTTVTSKEAMINGVQYETLEAAVNAAKDGDVIVLLANVELDVKNVDNNYGILTITEDITLDGNGKTITAENVTADADTDAGPSMINVEGGAKVTVKNLTIDGAGATSEKTDNTKHGLNVYGEGTEITVQNVTIQNGNGYGLVVNGAKATINGLTTSNNGWGGVNVDSKSGDASLTINNANIGEANSVKIENGNTSNDNPAVEINGGTFQYITKGDEITEPDLTISNGKFATGSYEGAVDVSDYLGDGLILDGNGNVITRPTTPSTPDTPSYGGSSEPSGDYIVSVDRVSGGKVTVNPGRADRGDEVTVTVKPNDGYELDELVVTDSRGNEVDLSYEGDGKYTFTMPSGTVDVEASFVRIDAGSVLDGFTDVNPNAWYAEAAEFVVEEGLMTGTSATTFAPDTSMSRAMIWTVLAAYNGYNTSGGNPWYAPGQQWAMVNGVSDGTTPNGSITREQLAVMLWRAAGSPETTESLSGYADASGVSDWAVEALAWAVDNGIISGMGGSTLAPQGTATRAQVAVMLMQFVSYMEG